MTHIEGLSLVDSKCLGSANCVLDLPTVQVVSCQACVILLIERHQVDTCDYSGTFDKNLEDGFLRLHVQIIISKRNVDSGLEGVIESLQTVNSSVSSLSPNTDRKDVRGYIPAHDSW